MHLAAKLVIITPTMTMIVDKTTLDAIIMNLSKLLDADFPNFESSILTKAFDIENETTIISDNMQDTDSVNQNKSI
jgi:hypothetical protein